ncbi:aurora kinase C [Aplysia californica]|uniref:Aurora kinase C n=1 Tax=Aplysia californica TaxID=6500 RepID=A0ABM1A6E6_APLCA|nr:aurora kinase C [Aplysia californica]
MPCCKRSKQRKQRRTSVQPHRESSMPQNSEYFEFMESQPSTRHLDRLAGPEPMSWTVASSFILSSRHCSGQYSDASPAAIEENECHLCEEPYYSSQRDGYRPGVWKTYHPEEFQTLKLNIFRGSTCKIHLVQHKESKLVAIMKILNDRHSHEALREMNMARLNRDSPFLLRILDGFRALTNYYILLEYAPFRTLDHLTSAVKGLGSANTCFYALEMACALDFLHDHQIIHRDVKPENTFVLSSGHVALGDFGSVYDTTNDTELPHRTCGTYVTRPPEVWSNQGYSYSVDIWELGISMCNLITNKWPIVSANMERHMALVQKGIIIFTSDYTPGASDLISKMCTVDPAERINIKEVLKHGYFEGVESYEPPFSPTHLLQVYSMREEERKDIERLLHLEEIPPSS